MTDVLIERQMDTPLTDADMHKLMCMDDGCLGLHRVDWLGSLLSSDRTNMFCHFRGPDAESVRIALRQVGAPTGHVWPCQIHDAPGFTDADLASANVVVSRRFDEPVDLAAIQAREDAGSGCLQMHRVRFVRTYFSTDRRRMICLYQAPDAESVRAAQREAQMPIDRVFAVRRIEP